MIDVDRGPAPDGFQGYPLSSEHRAVLHDWFSGKCYLTERLIDLSDFEVDHRHPKSDGGSDAWENLFPAAHKPNGHRARKLPAGGYLSPGEGVEERLTQALVIDAFDVRCIFEATDPHDLAAENTARELRHLHHGVEVGPIRWSKDLRDAIKQQLVVVQDVLIRAHEQPDNVALRGQLRILLSRKSPFTALLRSKFPTLRHLFD
jgi:hypothetical protein